MTKTCNLNFHQTFKPEAQYISSILSVADDETPYDIKDISNLTGIPSGKSSGKVEPHILYSYYMGLIDYKKEDGKYILSITSVGKEIEKEDPGLQEELSLLLCHAMMCREKKGADIWSSCFLKIFPKYRNGVKKDILFEELNAIYQGKVNTKNFAPFLGAYDDMFSKINILNVGADVISINTITYNKEYIFLYSYVLWTLWDEYFENQNEISSTQFDELNYGGIFGWNKEQEYQALEHMSDKGILRLNRQLMPYTILKLYSNQELINKMFSELC